MDKLLREKLRAVVSEADRIALEMGDPEIAMDPQRFMKLARKHREMAEVVKCFRRYEDYEAALEEAQMVLAQETDPELVELAEEQRMEMRRLLESVEGELRILLVPKDPNDEKNTIVEIRAGTGGEEAGLFVSDLFRMYSRYAETRGWKVEVLNSNATELGGYKEISFQISGDAVYSNLKWEGGVHRVQRVPDTETQGRIHTSAVTVAVLPEADDVDIAIDPTDLDIDVYRSSGAGGQHVNTTDSAVRITHRPTGIVVTCQDERSQHKNKAKALLVLRSRLLDAKIQEEEQSRSANRRNQVRSGDRSEKIRTYNYAENRVTDHRIHLSLYKLKMFLEGDIQDMLDALNAADRAARLAEAE